MLDADVPLHSEDARKIANLYNYRKTTLDLVKVQIIERAALGYKNAKISIPKHGKKEVIDWLAANHYSGWDQEYICNSNDSYVTLHIDWE